MSSDGPPNNNGENWFNTLMTQLVQNDTTLHQAVTQAFAQAAQVAAENTVTAQAAQSVAVAAQSIAEAQAQTAPAPAQPSKPSVAEPEPFDGQYENFEPFLYQLLANFRAKPQAYNDYHVKIDTALSWMQKGVAKEWATTMFRILEENPDHFASWDAFVADLKQNLP